jgi:hypothetical protein
MQTEQQKRAKAQVDRLRSSDLIIRWSLVRVQPAPRKQKVPNGYEGIFQCDPGYVPTCSSITVSLQRRNRHHRLLYCGVRRHEEEDAAAKCHQSPIRGGMGRSKIVFNTTVERVDALGWTRRSSESTSESDWGDSTRTLTR